MCGELTTQPNVRSPCGPVWYPWYVDLVRQLPVGLTKQLSLSPREREEVGRGEGGGLYDVYVSE